MHLISRYARRVTGTVACKQITPQMEFVVYVMTMNRNGQESEIGRRKNFCLCTCRKQRKQENYATMLLDVFFKREKPSHFLLSQEDAKVISGEIHPNVSAVIGVNALQGNIS